jgi:hypothetical protein
VSRVPPHVPDPKKRPCAPCALACELDILGPALDILVPEFDIFDILVAASIT